VKIKGLGGNKEGEKMGRGYDGDVNTSINKVNLKKIMKSK